MFEDQLEKNQCYKTVRNSARTEINTDGKRLVEGDEDTYLGSMNDDE